MFQQTQMLNLDTIRSFFITHKIDLEVERPLSKEEVYDLYTDAQKLGGHIFSSFIVMAAINANKNGIQTVFDSYESIEEAYIAFYMGYTQGPSIDEKKN
jgi:hypothetical protein